MSGDRRRIQSTWKWCRGSMLEDEEDPRERASAKLLRDAVRRVGTPALAWERLAAADAACMAVIHQYDEGQADYAALAVAVAAWVRAYKTLA